MRKTQVLVVDDEELYRHAIHRVLARAGHQVHTARSVSEGLGVVLSENVDLVLCDLKMPGTDGLAFVRTLREIAPDLPSIVMTGYGSAEGSVEALSAGAFWYLEKPFEHARLDVFRRLVDQAIEHGRLQSDKRALQM